ncbi:MAG: hypothetical protein R3A46_03465 [Thermomicrobiales bacterium]
MLPVFLYGTAFLISGRIGNLPLRIVLRTLCGGLILLAGIVQVWLGASWLLDVLASYAFGFAFVLSLGWLYLRLDRAVGGVPFIHSVEIPVRSMPTPAPMP